MITTEKHELVIVRGGMRRADRGFCPICSEVVELLSFDAAVVFSGFGGRELIRRIELAEIHAIETSGSDFSICRRSLEMEKRNVRDDR